MLTGMNSRKQSPKQQVLRFRFATIPPSHQKVPQTSPRLKRWANNCIEKWMGGVKKKWWNGMIWGQGEWENCKCVEAGFIQKPKARVICVISPFCSQENIAFSVRREKEIDSVVCVCFHVYGCYAYMCVCASDPWSTLKVCIGFSRTGLANGGEASCGCWEWNLSLPEEQPVMQR